MPRVEPLAREDLAEFEPFFEMLEQTIGFVPNSMRTLGRSPGILRTFTALSGAVLMDGKVPRPLKQLVAHVASTAAGCRYCQAHTAHAAHEGGLAADKLAVALDFERSPLFDDAERAALRVARDAAFVPNATTDEQFESLRRHFDDEEIVEIVAVISLFGWLNRWNDTMATELESSPLEFARRHLAPTAGWEPGRHVRGQSSAG